MPTVRLSARTARYTGDVGCTAAWFTSACSAGDSAADPAQRLATPTTSFSVGTASWPAQSGQIGVADERRGSSPYRHSPRSWRLLPLSTGTEIATERAQLFSNDNTIYTGSYAE